MGIHPGKAKFALIGHPPDIETFRSYFKFIKPEKNFRDKLILKLFEWTPPYKIHEWKDYTLDNQTFMDGVMIMVPFLPEMRNIKHREVGEKIEQALALARDENCTVAALGAFSSIIMQGREAELTRKFGLKITSGNTFTSALIIRSLETIMEHLDMDISEQTMAIVGASGDIGSTCTTYFSSRVKKLILNARGLPLLQKMVDERINLLSCEVAITDNILNVLDDARVFIFVTSSSKHLLHLSQFHPGTIVCDASVPLNVDIHNALRPDVFYYHGGIARIPHSLSPGFLMNVGSEKCFYGCQLEAIMIAQNPGLPLSWGRGKIGMESICAYLDKFDANPYMNLPYTAGKITFSDSDMRNYRLRFLNFKQMDEKYEC